ncbi:MAG: hypothetical protein ACRDTN_11040, partial [Mycobacterium sp.]
GQVLEAVDSDFNTLLELGFRSSIQKEWEWRVSRGESLKNLRAFEHLRPTTMQSAKRDEVGAPPARGGESGNDIDEDDDAEREAR